MKVEPKAARKLMIALGLNAEAVEGWSPKRLTTKLNNLPLILDAARELTEKDDRDLKEAVVAASETGEKIELEGDETEVPAATTESVTEPSESAVKPKKRIKAKPSKNGTSASKQGKGTRTKPDKKTTTIEPKKGKKSDSESSEGGTPTPKKDRIKIMGKYSAGPFARWLGRKGVSFEDAKRIMEENGGNPLSDSSLKRELKEHREQRKAVDVTKEDAISLRERDPAVFAKKAKSKVAVK